MAILTVFLTCYVTVANQFMIYKTHGARKVQIDRMFNQVKKLLE